jgi:hypothetical protein
VRTAFRGVRNWRYVSKELRSKKSIGDSAYGSDSRTNSMEGHEREAAEPSTNTNIVGGETSADAHAQSPEGGRG